MTLSTAALSARQPRRSCVIAFLSRYASPVTFSNATARHIASRISAVQARSKNGSGNQRSHSVVDGSGRGIGACSCHRSGPPEPQAAIDDPPLAPVDALGDAPGEVIAIPRSIRVAVTLADPLDGPPGRVNVRLADTNKILDDSNKAGPERLCVSQTIEWDAGSQIQLGTPGGFPPAQRLRGFLFRLGRYQQSFGRRSQARRKSFAYLTTIEWEPVPSLYPLGSPEKPQGSLRGSLLQSVPPSACRARGSGSR